LKSYLNKKQIAEVREKFSAIDGITDRLVLRYTACPFKNEQAREYARHEFAQRSGLADPAPIVQLPRYVFAAFLNRNDLQMNFVSYRDASQPQVDLGEGRIKVLDGVISTRAERKGSLPCGH
jgi:hypothetical protein